MREFDRSSGTGASGNGLRAAEKKRGAVLGFQEYQELKSSVHRELITKVDLEKVATMRDARVRSQVAHSVVHAPLAAMSSDGKDIGYYSGSFLPADKRFNLVVVDGRQPFYSEGITLQELADLMRALGAEYAMNLDGGGSSTMVVQGQDGRPRVLNSPIDNYIPGRERPVANHLGIYFGKQN